MELQPVLHNLLLAVMAPTQALSALDRQLRPHGAQGIYHGDVRVLSQALVTVGGREPEAIAASPAGPGVVEVIGLLRGVDEPHSGGACIGQEVAEDAGPDCAGHGGADSVAISLGCRVHRPGSG